MVKVMAELMSKRKSSAVNGRIDVDCCDYLTLERDYESVDIVVKVVNLFVFETAHFYDCKQVDGRLGNPAFFQKINSCTSDEALSRSHASQEVRALCIA